VPPPRMEIGKRRRHERLRRYCRVAGWSSAPSPGSDATGVSPRTSRALAETLTTSVLLASIQFSLGRLGRASVCKVWKAEIRNQGPGRRLCADCADIRVTTIDRRKSTQPEIRGSLAGHQNPVIRATATQSAHRAGEDRLWHGEAERLGGLEVDDQVSAAGPERLQN
jgi:hypothetical protein